MKTKTNIYTALGFIIQLMIIASLAYWYTLLANHPADEAVNLYATNLPKVFQDQSGLMLAHAGLAVLSMIFYGLARKCSAERSVRNVLSGLIFLDAIVLIILLIALY